MDVQKTLDYLSTVCTEALEEWRKGNTLVANQLPSAVQFAFNNIYAVHTMAPEYFPALYPQLFEQCDKIRVASEHDAIMREQVAMMPELQTQLTAQAAEIEGLKAAIAKLTATPPTEAEGDEPPAVTSGEGEPEAVDEVDTPADPESAKKPKGK